MTSEHRAVSSELEWLSKLISFNTVQDNTEGHLKAADYLKRELERLGCRVDMIDAFEDGRADSPKPNVIGYMDFGKKEAVAINCHYDVVPPGDGWSTDPFTMVLKNGAAYGRGASDDKGAIAISLGTLKRLAREGSKYNLQLVFPCEEEVGGELGTGYVLRKTKGRGVSMAIVLDSRKKAILGTSGVVRGTIRVHGVQAHAGQEWAGKNAISEGVRLLAEMEHYKEIRRRHVSRLSLPEPTLPDNTKCFGRFNVTVLNAGSAYNTIPGKLEARFDMRLIPEEKAKTAIAELRKFFWSAVKRTGVAAELGIDMQADGYAEDGRDVHIAGFMRAAGFSGEYATSGSNDGRFYHNLGIPTMVTGMQIARSHHKPDESIKISEIVETEDMLLRFLGEKGGR